MAGVKMTRDKLAAKKTCGPVLKTSRPFMIMETEQQLEHDEQLCFEEYTRQENIRRQKMQNERHIHISQQRQPWQHSVSTYETYAQRKQRKDEQFEAQMRLEATQMRQLQQEGEKIQEERLSREKKYDAQIKQRKQQQIYDERERQRQIQQQQTEYERQMQIYNAEVREAERARSMQD